MKFVLMCGIFPVIASVIIRKLFYDRVAKKYGGERVRMTGEQLTRDILRMGKAENVEVILKKRPFLPLSPNKLVLHPEVGASHSVEKVAHAALLAGLVLMARRQEKVFGWRKWAVKFGWAMPSFTLAAMIFGMISGRVPPGLAVGIVFAVLGAASIALWITLPVEREAAKQVAHYLEETNLVPRRDEGELLATMVKAGAWKRVVPGCVEWLVPKSKPRA
jgi:Zn-dependent membrane protease YugP